MSSLHPRLCDVRVATVIGPRVGKLASSRGRARGSPPAFSCPAESCPQLTALAVTEDVSSPQRRGYKALSRAQEFIVF